MLRARRNLLLRTVSLALLLGALSACSPLTVLNSLTPSASYAQSTYSYGREARQTLDVYSPAEHSTAGPVVVFFHGGSWNSGDKSGYAFLAEALTSRGMTVVVPNYRLYPQVRYPTFLEDAAQAVAWTVRHIGGSSGRSRELFVMGHSSGAYNAAMLALDERWLAAVGLTPAVFSGWIGLAGPYNFLPIQNPDVRPVFFHPNVPPGTQPIEHVDPHTPPALLIAPLRDDVVNPMRNTGKLAEQLRAAGVPVTVRYYDGVGHGTLVAAFARPLRFLAPVLQDVTRFVRE